MKTQAPSPCASFILSPRRQGAAGGQRPGTWLCPLPPKAPFPGGGGGSPLLGRPRREGRAVTLLPLPPPSALKEG